VGGGLWISFLKPGNVITIAAARSEDRIRAYVGAGFAFIGKERWQKKIQRDFARYAAAKK
jgi:hypothetical protein